MPSCRDTTDCTQTTDQWTVSCRIKFEIWILQFKVKINVLITIEIVTWYVVQFTGWNSKT